MSAKMPVNVLLQHLKGSMGQENIHNPWLLQGKFNIYGVATFAVVVIAEVSIAEVDVLLEKKEKPQGHCLLRKSQVTFNVSISCCWKLLPLSQDARWTDFIIFLVTTV